MKKLLVLVLALSMSLTLVACGSSETTTEEAAEPDVEEVKTTSFPEKDITLYCGYAAGGGSDVSMRLAVPYLE